MNILLIDWRSELLPLKPPLSKFYNSTSLNMFSTNIVKIRQHTLKIESWYQKWSFTVCKMLVNASFTSLQVFIGSVPELNADFSVQEDRRPKKCDNSQGRTKLNEVLKLKTLCLIYWYGSAEKFLRLQGSYPEPHSSWWTLLPTMAIS